MSYSKRYARYLATPDYETFVIHCLTIDHPALGFKRRIQNGLPADYEATTEGGRKRTYRPLAFELKTSRMAGGTQQRLQVNIDAMDGDVYIAIRAIDRKERARDPVRIRHRIYLSTHPDKPVIVPPPEYELFSIVPTPQVIKCDARAAGLGDLPAGKLFTVEEYPILGAQA